RAYDLHPNLLRRWVVLHREAQKHSGETVDVVEAGTPLPMETTMPSVESPTIFVPVRRMDKIPAPVSTLAVESPLAQAVVRIELRSATRDITLHWPAAEHQALSQLLHEVLA